MFFPSKYNIHVRFAEAQPNSLQLEGGKNDIFVPSREAARVKISHFCLPKAEVNEVGPRQNGRECYSCFFTSYGSWAGHLQGKNRILAQLPYNV